jgi:NADH-quinone oxidoreductase subunit J
MALVDIIPAWSAFALAQVAGSVLPPLAIVVLCIIAGIGTVLLLPGQREPAIRWIGAVVALVALLVLAAILIRAAGEYSTADIYFWIFSAIALIGAIRVISHPKPVYSALYFVLTVVASAGLFVLLWAEFVAAALILIYAGAILVTYVFVIMLAQQVRTGSTADAETVGAADYDQYSKEPLAATAAGFVLMAVLLIIIFERAGTVPRAVADEGFADTMPGLGWYLFYNQLVSLELAGLLLTLAMIGAILIARRRVLSGQPEAAALPTDFTPGEDDPHRIPVSGTANPEHKAYPES